MSRSERRRNARKERLRALVPRGGAVIGIDLGEDKQALALVDHDVRVLWRKTVRVPAHRLGEALDLAADAARERGFASVTVGATVIVRASAIDHRVGGRADLSRRTALAATSPGRERR